MTLGLDPAVVTVLTGAGIVLVQLFREQRNHRWDIQARAALAADLKVQSDTTAAALLKQNQATAAALAIKISNDQTTLGVRMTKDQNNLLQQRRASDGANTIALQTELEHHRSAAAAETDRLVEMVAENTTLTRGAVEAANRAYTTANAVNEKIAALGTEFNDLSKRQALVVESLLGLVLKTPPVGEAKP